MIAKRYGKSVQSVNPEFDAVAMNEIGFRRDQAWSIETETFQATYERVGEHLLTGNTEGDTQQEVESALLAALLADLRAVEADAADGDVLLVENESGVDYPRLHSTQRTVVVGFENRLHFTYTVDPPIRIGVYRPKRA
ncbi:MAG TPA: hypothetical protein VF035_07425 [Longimicrobiales bacterium]